ncbi:AsmA family protein [Shewanella surugensis]|uniref:AsmA family protein n=1 Tax=Shewanella surugensis TaxID=212020 RepID=A0ABT0LBQ3_9GAMM|nr:AsmA family protein [Shewanella surugensis]MCL1125133.1 AsmA family protein [Shewanella surugensis]
MKVIKWLVIALFTLCVAFAAYISLFFDPNDFKPQIIEFVKEKTGRQLTVTDDLKWTFFPHVGIELGGISVSNPQGFEYPEMLQVKQAVAEVEFLPLLQKAVVIQQLKLDGLTFILETQKDGRSGLDGLTASTSEQKPPSSGGSSASNTGGNVSRLEIGGIEIKDSQVLIINQQTGTEQVFSLAELTLGRFQLGEFATIDYELTAKLPDMILKSSGEGAVRLDNKMQNITVKDFEIKNKIQKIDSQTPALLVEVLMQVAVDLQAKSLTVGFSDIAAMDLHGSASIDVNYANKVPNINLRLDFDDVDFDKLSAAMVDETAKSSDDNNQSQQAAVEPDLSALKQVDLDAVVTVKSVKMNNLKSENWNMQAQLKGGVLNMNSLTADLYKGQLVASAVLDTRPSVPSYSFKKNITGVEIRPLLTDAAQVDLLAGLANLSIQGKGSSLIADNIKKNLIASGKFEIVDGALYGINVPQMIRQAEAKLSGSSVAETNEEKKTDFTRLTGSFTIAKGVASNDDLNMASPLVRINGAGNANIITQALDYQLSAKVVGSLEGQGGKKSNVLSGINIPLKITGTISEPKFALDTDALLKGKVKQETDKLQKKLKDKLLDKLGGF